VGHRSAGCSTQPVDELPSGLHPSGRRANTNDREDWQQIGRTRRKWWSWMAHQTEGLHPEALPPLAGKQFDKLIGKYVKKKLKNKHQIIIFLS
jgi:hypothetical protein